MLMTEGEAIAYLQEQLRGDQGFIARLRRGEGLDQAELSAIQRALGVLAAAWARQEYIPKAAALPLVDVSAPIFESADLYGNERLDIEQLADALVTAVDRVFYSPEPRMTEERAMCLVFGHLSGLPSLALALHHREHVADEWLRDVYAALDTLAEAWSTRSHVPKSIVAPMVNAPDLIRKHAGAYPREEGHLRAFADGLADRVRRCLS
jgi:hypothetical protein